MSETLKRLTEAMARQEAAVATAQSSGLPLPAPMNNDALLALQAAAVQQMRTQANWAAGWRPVNPGLPYPPVAKPPNNWTWPSPWPPP